VIQAQCRSTRPVMANNTRDGRMTRYIGVGVEPDAVQVGTDRARLWAPDVGPPPVGIGGMFGRASWR
jgi:hypothetical protein